MPIQFHVLVRDLTGRAYPLEGTLRLATLYRASVRHRRCRSHVVSSSGSLGWW